jgi:FkbM family methyltransferase
MRGGQPHHPGEVSASTLIGSDPVPVARSLRDLAYMTGVLGPRSGPTLYAWSMARHHLPGTAAWRSRAQRFRLPGLAHALWLRPGTSDSTVLFKIFVDQEYDIAGWPTHAAALQAAYDVALDRGQVPVVIDCGANVGLSSVWFARRFPRARVVAIEPQPENHALLARNAASWGNIVPLHAAVSDHRTEVALIDMGHRADSWRTEEQPGGLATVTIDDALATVPGGVPLVVKVDIEGAEADLFRSSTGWLERTPLVIVETHDWMLPWRGTGHAVLSALVRSQRDYLTRGENIFAFAPPG